MMFIGLKLVLKPLSVIGSIIPFIGDIIAIGTGIVAFFIALPLSLITIAIAWFSARPLISIILLIIAGAAIATFIYLKKQNKKKPQKSAVNN